MNPVPFILLAISLPLLLGGCGEKEVNFEELEEREGIYYVSGSDTPYTGKSFTLNENGKKASERNFKDGKFDGLETVWWNYGKKASERNFKNGKKEGLHVVWHKNGQKEAEVNYKDGRYDGLRVGWHSNGNKFREENWKDGELISEKWWNNRGEPVDSYSEAIK